MAIALLPLKEGETLGSNFGGYAELMKLKTTGVLRQRLFGYGCRPGTRLPLAIAYLAEQTRDYWNLNAEEIVNNHTEYRYATMMASPAIREKIFKRMITYPTSEVCVIKNYGLKGERATTLRYCQVCLSEWSDNKLTSYWKLDHQLAGVYCCATHFCILKAVNRTCTERRSDLTVARSIHPSDELILQRTSSSAKRAIEDIAKRSVRQRAEGNMYQSVDKYRNLIREAGYFRSDSTLKRDVMIAEWLEYFGPEYCHLTNINVEKVLTWLSGLSEVANTRESPHPFMFIAAESFLEHCAALPDSYLPALRCEDPTSSSGLRIVAPDLDSFSCKGALHRYADIVKCVGLLRVPGEWKLVCTCGMSYRILDATRCGVVRVIPMSYGPRYRKRFAALIANGVSIVRAGRELGLSRRAASIWAHQGNLGNIDVLSQMEIKKLRTRWRRLVESTSSESRITTAAGAEPTLYRRLLRYDREWLLAFNRGHRSWRRKSSYEVKGPTSDQIRDAWRELMQAEPPIRATRGAILERAGFRRARASKRPFSVVLTELAESQFAYHERVISWLATLRSRQRLGYCDEAIRQAGLLLRSFTREQRNRIGQIESMNLDDS
ncbi:TnsD family Tn7-like transposition protein [Paraburkholderia guartelaensis]|uniref:TnsD family Tn7-like transposition protein n=1 Tax=Paraburkholderia guartelaensis TaxID=2546446 RepID=UPI002AB6AABF|nr:TnsD family Tn7-like transposition protein [Paraburkholderia guartelaensis]